ncbi:MAG: DUF4928 family protein [Dehalococcoidia bacterium]
MCPGGRMGLAVLPAIFRREPGDELLTPPSEVRELVEKWFLANRGRSTLGVANAGLMVLEYFRNKCPLEESDYLTPGGSQVRGLSGARALEIIRRFLPSARPVGTESGRTSRGTASSARNLASILNDLVEPGGDLTADERSRIANAGQEWLVAHPIQSYYQRQRLSPDINSSWSAHRNIQGILEAAGDRRGIVAQHLVGAKLSLRFPGHQFPIHSYSTADAQTGRSGDFQIGQSALHVTVAPGQPLMEKCRSNVRDGLRVVVIVTEGTREGAKQLVATNDLSDYVTVTTIESFVGQNVDEISEFDSAIYPSTISDLLRRYNERIAAVEPDASLQIEIPKGLSSG